MAIPKTSEIAVSRRDLLRMMGGGFGLYGYASLLGNSRLHASVPSVSADPLAVKATHFPAKAKRVIFLFMNGGLSQVDTFDPKPQLTRHHGQPMPGGYVKTERKTGNLMRSPFRFKRYGQSGIEVSELFSETARHIDDISVIRSMHTEVPNHPPGMFLMNCGHQQPGRPSLGSWITYGLGTENRNLPGFMVLCPSGGPPTGGVPLWNSAFLPAVYQGTRVRSEGSPLLNLHPREEWPSPVVKLSRSLLRHLDRNHLSRHPDEAELEARIAGYELAARMQLAASDALDVSGESEAIREMYGLNDELTASYGKRCLMARRLVERGVRLVQIYIEGQIWDNHNALVKNLGYACGKTDKPAAALLKDLKLRGLLDRTLVVWGGEFGRLPIAQQPASGEAGRDHGPSGFSVWLAGGGIKEGTVYGATDDIGYKAAVNPVSVHDLHATILHLLGMNHRELIFEREGRSERLTDEFPARIVQDIIA